MRAELAELITSIGGESVLFSILNEFYLRMSKDLMIGFFFEKHDLEHIALMQGKFILNAAGLIPSFEGKGPSTAHTALPPILSGHFDRRLVILRETLSARSLGENQIETWARFEESFRAIVVSD
jgi:truncated hemoglobin YjbI